MVRRRFQQVDVFGAQPYLGNPVAVLLDGDELADAEMQQIASWTNLSETTFVTHPSDSEADYRVRIFTPESELPFAGHPTLGTAHAWLTAHTEEAEIVQECAAGRIRIRRTPEGLAFAAPPLRRSGPVDEIDLAPVRDALGLAPEEVVDAQWADNGPGWIALLLADSERVLSLRPTAIPTMVGVAGPLPEGSGFDFEVRAFFPANGQTVEDPVTGSLNAALGGWLIPTGRAGNPYLVRQGSALGREGRVHVSRDEAGDVWVAGSTLTCVAGEIDA